MIEVKINQVVYTVNKFNIIRWKVIEIINIESVEGKRIEYKVEDGLGRKNKINPSEISMFDNLKDAKTLALQQLEVTVKDIYSNLEALSDKKIDKLVEEAKEQMKKKKEKK